MSAVFLRTLLQMLTAVPALISCFQVSRDFHRFSLPRSIAVAAAITFPAIFFCSTLTAQYNLPIWVSWCAEAAIIFAVMRAATTLSWSALFAIFIGVLAIETFPLQFACLFDAHLHPESGVASMSPEAAAFQLLLAVVLMAGFSYPASHQFAALVRDLETPGVWYIAVVVCTVFLGVNLFSLPMSYSVLRAGRLRPISILLEASACAALIALFTLLYRGARLLIRSAQLRERSQIFEREAHEYRALRTYMDETARLRHDFRHSVHLLSSLAERGDLDSIREYLRSYETTALASPPANYCRNSALNALFQYYGSLAEGAGIDTGFDLDLPDPLPYPELDLASVFGNLLDNAIAGCMSVPEAQRRLRLTTRTHGGSLYIVATNTFDGRVRRDRHRYLSTKHAGQGTGLSSITAVAERHGGHAVFSNEDLEFHADVVLKIPRAVEG